MNMTVSSPFFRNAEIVNIHDSIYDYDDSTIKSLPSVDTLFVWDFDWTIVNCNSDEYVPAAFLGTDVSTQRLRTLIQTHGPTKWHDCVASLINNCMEEKGCTMHDVCNAAASMPYLVDVRGSLIDVEEDGGNCGQAIISDGNDSFIGAFLRAHVMEHFFTHGVETNIGEWTNVNMINETNPTKTSMDRPHQFSVVHQSTKYCGGHSCKTCPPNLCKTQVLLHILNRMEEKKRPRIVYIGDGENDACPALHVLNEGDVLLARVGRKTIHPNTKLGEQVDDADDGSAMEQLLAARSDFGIISAMEKRQKEGGVSPRCQIRKWATGKQLRSHVRDLLDDAKN